MTKAQRKLQQARVTLVLGQPFWATLLMRLEEVVDNSQDTMWTDGHSLGYNEKFVEELPMPILEFVLAHETSHCAHGHPWRQGNREDERWNAACDYAINHILEESRFKIWEHALMNPAFKGLAAEQIYEKLPSGFGKGGRDGAGSGSGGIAPQSFGRVRKPPSEDHIPTLEADWKVAVLQAANAARAAGNLPRFAKRMVEDIRKPKIEWESVLMRFVQLAAKNDYSWQRPNPRYMPSGIYMPSMRSEEMGEIVIAADTSGSIGQKPLRAFGSEMQGVIDMVRPKKTIVMWWDTKVHRIDEFEQGDPLVLKPIGGGGTLVGDVFRQIEKNEYDPACLLILTDMDIGDLNKLKPPPYPVMWVSTKGERAIPFGELLILEVD